MPADSQFECICSFSPGAAIPVIMSSTAPVASPSCGATVSTALDHLTLCDFTVFDWTQSSPADSEKKKAVCTLISSNIARVRNGQVHLKETATISTGHTASGESVLALDLLSQTLHALQ